MSNTDRIIRLKTVLARTGLSRSTLYRKIADGTFPAQIRISVHGAGWRESTVERCLADPVSYREERAGSHAQGPRSRPPIPSASASMKRRA